jgi:hypothetical protein
MVCDVRGIKANTCAACLLPSPSPFLILLPLSLPSMDLNDLGSSSPAVTATSAEHSSHRRTQHAQSDCGHYHSPQLKPSHSLLRNFSLRSRNTLSLRKVNCPPPPPLASRPANVRNHSASPSMDSTSSDTNSSSSVWKKWRVKCVPNPNTLGARDGDLNVVPAYRDTVSCPHRSARKRSLFLPFLNVSRLVAPFQIPSSSSSSSSSDDSPCVIIVSFLFISVDRQMS